MTKEGSSIGQAFRAALPVMIGYVALGVPCGILGAAAHMTLMQILLLSVFMYSGTGQYMIPNLFLAGMAPISLSATVTLVSSRQMLYGSALAEFFSGVRKSRLVLYAATVTDETFGVNIARFQAGMWTPKQAQAVNSFSHLSWTLSNLTGALLGAWLVIDTRIAAFAMTSLFICLLLSQHFDRSHVLALFASIAGVIICKLLGLGGPAILAGALLGIAVGFLDSRRSKPTAGKGVGDAVE